MLLSIFNHSFSIFPNKEFPYLFSWSNQQILMTICFYFLAHRVELSSHNPNIYTPPTKNSNRNYYNVSDNTYKQPPSQYDAYYPIYEDDVELYHEGMHNRNFATFSQMFNYFLFLVPSYRAPKLHTEELSNHISPIGHSSANASANHTTTASRNIHTKTRFDLRTTDTNL